MRIRGSSALVAESALTFMFTGFPVVDMWRGAQKQVEGGRRRLEVATGVEPVELGPHPGWLAGQPIPLDGRRHARHR